MKITKLFKLFFESEKSSGLLLIGVTFISLFVANSSAQASYLALWDTDIAGHSLQHWINDGLMTLFFLLIGLELEREIYIGELSSIKNASLPVAGALGGMLMPAVLFLAFNWGLETQSGFGIPMATDIAFALGVLSLLGNRVPTSLKVFLTALAVIDDLGAILVIAIFYSKSLILVNLLISLAIFVALLVLNRMKVHALLPYLVGGVALWYFMLNSGVHATISGVLLAFAIPFGNGDENSPSYKLQSFLHQPVAFFIMPLFALANTSIVLQSNWQGDFLQPYSLGIFIGLLLGKPIGITLLCFFAVQFRWALLPSDVSWKALTGTGFIAGIGFTMSIFITLLALDEPHYINHAKFVILLSSFMAGILGYIFLRFSLKTTITDPDWET